MQMELYQAPDLDTFYVLKKERKPAFSVARLILTMAPTTSIDAEIAGCSSPRPDS